MQSEDWRQEARASRRDVQEDGMMAVMVESGMGCVRAG
jgi:hypothetical protein